MTRFDKLRTSAILSAVFTAALLPVACVTAPPATQATDAKPTTQPATQAAARPAPATQVAANTPAPNPNDGGGSLEPQGPRGGARGGAGGRGGGRGGPPPADYRTGANTDTAPQGFDANRPNIAHGKLERVEYDATAISPTLKRWMMVYTPAGYDPKQKYPVLVLMHGIGGNEQLEWTRHTQDNGAADYIMDNLIADKKCVPMIVLFPNGNVTQGGGGGAPGGAPGGGRGGGRGGRGGGAPGGAPGGGRGGFGGGAPGGGAPGPGAAIPADGTVFVQAAPAPGGPGAAPGGAPGAPGGAPGGGRGGGRGGPGGGAVGGDGWNLFTTDLIKDILPFVEAHYSVYNDANHRALGGLSMGGGQTLNIGLTHSDTFAYLGAFSNAPNTQQPNQLVPDDAAVAKLNKELKLFWIGVGDNDQTVGLGPYNFHKAMLAKGVNHLWHVDVGGHTMPVWKQNLYLFAQRIFKDDAQK